jgi:hypothetical protein
MIILGLLNRRGCWMTPVEIFEASADYPEDEYVMNDLRALKANGLIVSRPRTGTTLIEYGLPTWVNAPTPAFSFAYFVHMLNRFVGQIATALHRG